MNDRLYPGAAPDPHQVRDGERGPSITVLAVGGTGESWPADERTGVSGLLRAVTDELDDRFVCRWVGYPASYGPTPRRGGISFAESVTAGVHRLRETLARTDGPVALIGYSQGAVVIREALAEISYGSGEELTRLVGVGLVADPHQPPGAVDGCAGWGVAGPGSDLPPGIAVCWVGVPDDLICNAAADSLVRDVADLTRGMTLTSVGPWRRMMWNTLRANDLQNARRTAVRPAQWRRDVTRVGVAWREVRCYLPVALRVGGVVVRNRLGGRHTSYAGEPYRRTSVTDPGTTGCQVVAYWLQVRATFGGRPSTHAHGTTGGEPGENDQGPVTVW